MEKKCSGPNIGTWSTRIQDGEYVKHANGCNGLMLQIVTSSMTLSPKGKPYCEKCNKIMGRKAYRKILKLLQDNHIKLEHYIGDRGSNRIFFRSDPDEYPEPLVSGYNAQRPAPLDSSLSAVETYKNKRDASEVDRRWALRQFDTAIDRLRRNNGISVDPHIDISSDGPHYTFTHGSLTMRVPYDTLTGKVARRLGEEILTIPKQFDGAASMQHLLAIAIERTKTERTESAPEASEDF